jgi:cyclopropane-fatty-acyl-phospholipid synthase
MLLEGLLDHLVTVGTLRVIDAGGRIHTFGGRAAGPVAAIRLHDRRVGRELFWNPRLKAGEAYMDGRLTVEDGFDIYDFIDVIAVNMAVAPPSPYRPLYLGFGNFMRALQQWNPVDRARKHVAHHYDLSDALYDLFLDKDRQYSCAYFTAPGVDLETAQLDKKRHLAAKLRIEPGHRVLDIGSGWGGLALFLAAECGAAATGLTLSQEQLKVAQRRALAEGLADRVSFHLRDYREEAGTYDRIVSVGMFEHVGVPHYRAFFEKIRDLLAEDGVAVLHSIGRADGPGRTNPWMRKYIFPGGYAPALSEVLPHIERAGLWMTDVEILRLHYAETLRRWRERFAANRDKVRALYDERFCRMWEFYLAGSEIAFRRQDHMNFQIQLTRRVDALPLTRDYIHEWENRPEPGRLTGRAA